MAWPPVTHSDVKAKIDELIASGGAAVTHYSQSVNTSTYNTTLTLGATPVANSLQIHANGLLLTPGVDYTLSGAVVTFLNTPASGVKIVDRYVALTSSPAASVLSGNASPLRGTTVATNTGSSTTVALPAGTAAGDVALLYSSSYDTESIPTLNSGWTSLNTSSGFGGQRAQWKKLDAGDISAGTVTAGFAGSGNFTAVLTVALGKDTVAFLGHNRNTNTTSSGTVTATPTANDILVWAGITRNDAANPPVPTFSRTATTSGSGSNATSAGVARFEIPVDGTALSATHTVASSVQLVTLGAYAIR